MGLKDFSLGDKFEKAKDFASEYGNKAADMAKKGSEKIVEKAGDVQYSARLNYYNPLFPEEFQSSDFDLPRMIVIEDEDERKDVDVCKGACGWISTHKKFEVLHLYGEYVEASNLTFVPFADYGFVFYSHPFDRNLFINLSSYIERMQAEKNAELRMIAQSLGAKSCELEISEGEKVLVTASAKNKRHLKAKSNGANVAIDGNSTNGFAVNTESQKRQVFRQTFSGSDSPVRPELKWFKHDPGVNAFIEQRCAHPGNVMKTNEVQLSSEQCLSLSLNTAQNIELALNKIGVLSNNFSLVGEIQKERRTKMTFIVEF